MQAWLAPNWWQSALCTLVISLIMGATGLLSLFWEAGQADHVLGALFLFLGGATFAEALYRFRAARSAKTLNSPRKGIEL